MLPFLIVLPFLIMLPTVIILVVVAQMDCRPFSRGHLLVYSIVLSLTRLVSLVLFHLYALVVLISWIDDLHKGGEARLGLWDVGNGESRRLLWRKGNVRAQLLLVAHRMAHLLQIRPALPLMLLAIRPSIFS